MHKNIIASYVHVASVLLSGHREWKVQFVCLPRVVHNCLSLFVNFDNLLCCILRDDIVHLHWLHGTPVLDAKGTVGGVHRSTNLGPH